MKANLIFLILILILSACGSSKGCECAHNKVNQNSNLTK